MQIRKVHTIAVAVIAGAFLASQARAEYLHVGTPFGPSITLTGTSIGDISGAGGDFQNSTIGPDAGHQSDLPWVFCVDVEHHVSPPTNAANTLVRTDGYVNNALVNNAAQVAYVLLHYTAGLPGDLSHQGSIQAAIWKIIYGGTITGIGGSGSYGSVTEADSYVADAQANATAADIAKVRWLTLNPTTNNVQGLVTVGVPEPSSFAIAGVAGLGMLYYARRRRRS